MTDLQFEKIIKLLEKLIELHKKKPRQQKEPSEWHRNQFEALWGYYPSKDGKKEAFKHFCASVNSDEDLRNLNLALYNYKAHLKKETWKKPKNGKTFFNNWQDWINDPTKPTTNPHWDHKNEPKIGQYDKYGNQITAVFNNGNITAGSKEYEYDGEKYIEIL